MSPVSSLAHPNRRRRCLSLRCCCFGCCRASVASCVSPLSCPQAQVQQQEESGDGCPLPGRDSLVVLQSQRGALPLDKAHHIESQPLAHTCGKQKRQQQQQWGSSSSNGAAAAAMGQQQRTVEGACSSVRRGRDRERTRCLQLSLDRLNTIFPI